MSETITPSFQFMLVISIILIAAGIFTLVSIFMSPDINVVTEDIKRASNSIAENLFSSELTKYRALFMRQALDAVKSNVEPVRHCSYAYSAVIEGLGTTMCKESDDCRDSWSFGYKPGYLEPIQRATRSFPAGIYLPDLQHTADFYETAEPARLTLTLYDTWSSRLSCLAETAYMTKKHASMEIPCIEIPVDYERRASDILSGMQKITKCGISLKRIDDELCVFTKGTYAEHFGEKLDCRYAPGIPVSDFYFYSDKSFKKKTITAVPVRGDIGNVGGFPGDDPQYLTGCDYILEKEDSNPDRVAFCVG